VCGAALAATPLPSEAPLYSKGFKRQPSPENEVLATINITLSDMAKTPRSIDWSTKGALTPIKDQGKCGSCWAFSTIQGVESAVFRSSGKLPEPLSTEQLVDCDKFSDGGCNGGDIPTAVRYLKRVGSADAEDYPDRSSKIGIGRFCTWDRKSVVDVTKFSFAIPQCKFGDCSHQNEEALAAAVAQYGPVSICINSGEDQSGDWMKYKGGVLSGTCSASPRKVDHCVQLVGFDKDAPTPYWKIRNSWGADWGENGFIRIPYGQKNACCVGCEAVIIEAHMAD